MGQAKRFASSAAGKKRTEQKKERAKADGLKLADTLILGDLNMRLTRSEWRKLEYQNEEASDSENEGDDDMRPRRGHIRNLK